MIEDLAEVLKRLEKLKERTTKQPFYHAPDVVMCLSAISEFMEKDLGYAIDTLEAIISDMEGEEQ